MELEIFKQNIIKVIQHSNLPIGVIYYVLKDILRTVETEYSQFIEMQKPIEKIEVHKEEEEEDE